MLIWNVSVYAKPKKIVWRAQSSYPAGLPQHYEPAARSAEKMEKLTDGQLVVKMNPGGAIGPSKKIFDAAGAGTLDLACSCIINYCNLHMQSPIPRPLPW